MLSPDKVKEELLAYARDEEKKGAAMRAKVLRMAAASYEAQTALIEATTVIVSSRATRTSIWTLGTGDVRIEWPTRIRSHEVDDLEEYLKLLIRIMRRTAEKFETTAQAVNDPSTVVSTEDE